MEPASGILVALLSEVEAMTYVIDIIKQGYIVDTVEGIEAFNALEAINRIEAQFKAKAVSLSDRGGAVQCHQWTGYEFQARRLGMMLS